MAYNESSELPVGQGYWLGNYSFELHVDQVHEPGEEDVVSVYAVCRHISPGGTQESRETQVVDFPVGTTVESWRVEANDDTADVYVSFKPDPLDTGPVSVPFPFAGSSQHGNSSFTWTYTGGMETLAYASRRTIYHIFASATEGAAVQGSSTQGDRNTAYCRTTFSHAGKTVYYTGFAGASWPSDVTFVEPDCGGGNIISLTGGQMAAIAWIMIYGDPANVSDETLVGRFAIDIREAGGGPGGDWDEPGSVEPDPEPGEPEQTHTLTLTTIAALSGRHNDPLNDNSYSYLPADNTTVKPYGCGGDGGHGGGGGGGASTMVVRKIATDKASHTEVIAHTKRHGYGSGGGKGGKGGDGCILVFW